MRDDEAQGTSGAPRPLGGGAGLILEGSGAGGLLDAAIVEATTSTGEQVLAVTHAGYGYKDVNEDRVAMIEVADRGGSRAGFFVVDGMGGYLGGDVAAQIVAEELLEAYRLDHQAAQEQSSQLLLSRAFEAIDRFPSPAIVAEAARAVHERVLAVRPALAPEDVLRVVAEIGQSQAYAAASPSVDDIERIAFVIHELSKLTVPDRADLAMQRTKTRLAQLSHLPQPPDACFIGAVIETAVDGGRELDVKQIGDCKLFVASADGKLRFESINDSLIPEPDLRDPSLSLAQLMTYSLHRNIVSSSVLHAAAVKRYRRSEVPLRLAPGDLVCIYSDGCDDLFAPEEIVALAQQESGVGFVRSLLAWGERRMRYVHALLLDEHSRLPPEDAKAAYPAVHQYMNEARLRDGQFIELYEDGSEGRWVKPPKCDNFAFCMVKLVD